MTHFFVTNQQLGIRKGSNQGSEIGALPKSNGLNIIPLKSIYKWLTKID
jgi:hypothetical protein